MCDVMTNDNDDLGGLESIPQEVVLARYVLICFNFQIVFNNIYDTYNFFQQDFKTHR